MPFLESGTVHVSSWLMVSVSCSLGKMYVISRVKCSVSWVKVHAVSWMVSTLLGEVQCEQGACCVICEV